MTATSIEEEVVSKIVSGQALLEAGVATVEEPMNVEEAYFNNITYEEDVTFL